MIRALVFDFDGLIVDTEGPVFQAWSGVYEEHGLELSRTFWQGIIGRASNWVDPLADLEAQLGRALDRDAITTARRAREMEMVVAQPILPGVETWKADARRLGLKLGVASSSSRAWVTGHLVRLGLAEGWDCIRCRDDVARAKPDPELYLAVVDQVGVPPAEALAIEDSPNGLAAAVAAGLRSLVVPNPLTADLDFEGADLRLDSLAAMSLEEALARLG